MKNRTFWTRILGIAVILAVMVFSACDDGGGDNGGGGGGGGGGYDNVPAEFIGKWVYTTLLSGSTITATWEFKTDKIIYTFSMNGGIINSYEIINLTITLETNTSATTNADYPAGFKYTGTLANVFDTALLENGKPAVSYFYMHTNKQSIINITQQEYDKQP